MMPVFFVCLAIIALGIILLLQRVHLNIQGAMSLTGKPLVSTVRYYPMLRLLTEEPLNGVNRRQFRARRRAIFRGYLRALSRDYARLLGGLRLVMVQSEVDRPDLANAIRESRTAFTVAMLRIEIGLWRHAAGIGTVDVSGLVGAMDRLRASLPQLAPELGASMIAAG